MTKNPMFWIAMAIVGVALWAITFSSSLILGLVGVLLVVAGVIGTAITTIAILARAVREGRTLMSLRTRDP